MTIAITITRTISITTEITISEMITITKTMFQDQDRVDQVAVTDICSTILAGASNGMCGGKNNLTDFITINFPGSGTRAYRWVIVCDELSQFVVLSEHAVNGLSEDDRPNVCGGYLVDPRKP